MRKRSAHTDKRNQWSADARRRLVEKGQTPNLALGTPAAQRSPLAGPFETNQEAKKWWVVSLEDGAQFEIVNLRNWCRAHPDLFAPDGWPAAYAGLRQVQAWLAGKTPRRVSRWKHWTLARVAEDVHATAPPRA